MGLIDDLFGLEGQTAVVTGGSGAIGGTFARALVDAGARVAVLGRNAEACEALCRSVDPERARTFPLAADVLSHDDLTAARPDRTSFGCSAEETYTYWDGCLVDSFPGVSTWEELYERVTACVEEKESGGFTPSEPQASFGDDMVALPIFDRE